MSVHRITPLPTGTARGRIVVTHAVVERTVAHLAAEGRRDVPHEGLAWWLGRRIGDDTYVMSCVAPPVDSGLQHVFANETAVGDAAAAARRNRLGIVAQVHSHPGGDTRHSDGDDALVLMPFEDMFSIVTAHYGASMLDPLHAAGVHQYQDGRWVWITDRDRALFVVPDEIPL